MKTMSNPNRNFLTHVLNTDSVTDCCGSRTTVVSTLSYNVQVGAVFLLP